MSPRRSASTTTTPCSASATTPARSWPACGSTASCSRCSHSARAGSCTCATTPTAPTRSATPGSSTCGAEAEHSEGGKRAQLTAPRLNRRLSRLRGCRNVNRATCARRKPPQTRRKQPWLERSGSWLDRAPQAQWRAQSSAHRFLHERADPCLFGGSQLRQCEGGRPHDAFVEVRLVAEAERRVPRLELLRALEEADD